MNLAIFVLLAVDFPTQFQPAIAENSKVREALASIDTRREPLVQEWIHVTEISAPSGGEKDRARYLRAELEKIGLTGIRVDSMGNLEATRKGTEPGPPVVFAAHMDTVFAASTPLKVERSEGVLRCPGIGDDTGGLVALLEAFRALQHSGIRTRRDLVFLATVQEETRLQGMRHWLTQAAVKPAMLVAVDIQLGSVWYGAFRISRLQFFYTSPGAHTLVSRGQPNPAKAVSKGILDLYALPLPEPATGLGEMRLPVLNVGKIGGGTVINAIPQEAWFTVDLRSLDSATQDRLESQVAATAKKAAQAEGVGFRMEKPDGDDLDYSKALPKDQRRKHPMVQTAVDINNFLKLNVAGAGDAVDAGSTDANVGVAMGVPSIAVGAIRHRNGHTLTEQADESSIVTGTKMLILLASSLAGLAK